MKKLIFIFILAAIFQSCSTEDQSDCYYCERKLIDDSNHSEEAYTDTTICGRSNLLDYLAYIDGNFTPRINGIYRVGCTNNCPKIK